MGRALASRLGLRKRGWLSDELLGERGVRMGVYWRERTLEALFRSLNTLHMIGGTPRVTFVAGRRRVPSEATREPICEWVAVNRGGERLAARAIHGRGDYRMTAASTIACAEALLQLRDTDTQLRGVFAPEELFTLSELQPAFERLGFGIRER